VPKIIPKNIPTKTHLQDIVEGWYVTFQSQQTSRQNKGFQGEGIEAKGTSTEPDKPEPNGRPKQSHFITFDASEIW